MKMISDEERGQESGSLSAEILERIKRIESAVSEGFGAVSEHIKEKEDLECLLRHGLHGYKERIKKSEKEKEAFNPQAWILRIIQKHPDLRYPHRKILDYLSRQYNYEKQEFSEVNMSTLVRECRLGKNRVKEYLKLLEGKGLVKMRNDGYRVWVRLTILTKAIE